jgi:membrane-bound lytic murein transglycosylase MltF
MKTTYDDDIKAAALTHLGPGYDWRLLKAQYWQESRLDPHAVSEAGAAGIAQIMPDTWSDWSGKTGYAGVSHFNPVASINVGAAYMNYLMKQWYWERPELDRIALALASYNAGLGHLLNAQAEGDYPHLYADIIKHLPDITGDDDAPETIGYVHKVFKFWIKIVEKG